MNILEFLGLIFIFILCWKFGRSLVGRISQDPDNFYRGYVVKLGEYEEDGVAGIFFQAGENWNKDRDTIVSDYHNFIDMGIVPPYLRSFVREHIKKMAKGS